MAYIDKDYKNRQCLMILEDDRGINQSEIDLFTRCTLPNGLSFSTGSANLNTLYIAHPAQKGFYIPFEQHEMAFFRDKMDELILLAQSLGATDIEIVRSEGVSSEEILNKSNSWSVNGSFKKVGGSVSGESVTSTKTNTSNTGNIHIKIKSSPVNFPQIPENLHWYHLHPEWEKMARQRLLGLEEYELEVCSSYSGSLSESKMSSLNTALKVVFLNVDTSRSKKAEEIKSSTHAISFSLKIKFRPLSEYKANLKNINKSENEAYALAKYRESCKSLIGNKGKINDMIKIELNRIRENLQLPASKAQEIEQEFIKAKKKSRFWPFW